MLIMENILKNDFKQTLNPADVCEENPRERPLRFLREDGKAFVIITNFEYVKLKDSYETVRFIVGQLLQKPI